MLEIPEPEGQVFIDVELIVMVIVVIVISVLRHFSTSKVISAGVQFNLVILRTVEKDICLSYKFLI